MPDREVSGSPHKAKLIKEFVKAQNGQLKLFYLPPYSPHLNPDEQVWAHVKRQIARQLVQSKDAIRMPICRHMTFFTGMVGSMPYHPQRTSTHQNPAESHRQIADKHYPKPTPTLRFSLSGSTLENPPS